MFGIGSITPNESKKTNFLKEGIKFLKRTAGSKTGSRN